MPTTFERVKKILVDTIGCDPDKVTLDAKIIDDIGADSLDVVEIVMSVEEEFGVEFPVGEEQKIVLVKDVVEWVDRAVASRTLPAAIFSPRPGKAPKMKLKANQRVPEYVMRALKEARAKATFESADFGFDQEIVTVTGMGSNPDNGKTVDQFVKDRSGPYRRSWLIPQIDIVIAWAEGN